MGRPINFKKIGGNTNQDGNQLQFLAWFEGEAGPETAWVSKQVATNRFRLVAEADNARTGIFPLSENPPSAAGQASLQVTGFIFDGTITAPTIANSGDVSDADGDYTVTLVGGTFTEAATLTATVLDGEVTVITLISGGVYSVAPSSPATVTGLTGTSPSIGFTFVAIPEAARKIAQHRVITFEGNGYKYDIDVVAGVAGEATIRAD
jgi:hypothetical protein